MKILLCRALEVSVSIKYSQYSPSHLESQAFCPPSSSQLQGAFVSRGIQAQRFWCSGASCGLWGAEGSQALLRDESQICAHFLTVFAGSCGGAALHQGSVRTSETSSSSESGNCEKSCFHKILWNWLLTNAVWARKLHLLTHLHIFCLWLWNRHVKDGGFGQSLCVFVFGVEKLKLFTSHNSFSCYIAARKQKEIYFSVMPIWQC